ncbi:hypothetical protein [Erysipelothrix anatis]|uniref:hypothetical protein n=1 Tax=Erysipelothrix anatis TaxID=2683713 RepID=UPI001359DEB1|nr:hypothetical protein [Erysipelothrix anatis]
MNTDKHVNRETKPLNVYFVLLSIGYLFLTASLVLGRNTHLMNVAVFLKLLASLGLAYKTRSKLMIVSSLLQIFSYIIVYISGSMLMNAPEISVYIIILQADSLQVSYVLNGIADALLLFFTKKLAQTYAYRLIFQYMAIILAILTLLGTLGFFDRISLILIIMVPVFELTIYALIAFIFIRYGLTKNK